MKTPRIDAFVTPDKIHELASPLDGLTAIRPHGAGSPERPAGPAPPTTTPKPATDVPRSAPTQTETDAVQAPMTFDLLDYPTKTVTFPVTEQESLILDELKLEIARIYQPRVTATKEKLLRLAIHYMIDDFRKNGKDSFIVQRLNKKSK